VLVHVAAPNTGPWSLLPRERPPFRKALVGWRPAAGGDHRQPRYVARPGTAAPRCGPKHDRRSCRARARDGVERARMATPGSTASPSNSRIALAHEGSEAVTRCATVLTRPASSVRLLDYPVLIASGRFSDHERWPPRAGGCRGADRDRREGGRVARPHPRLPTPRRKTRPQTPPDMTR
jgi:hypothetical protein